MPIFVILIMYSIGPVIGAERNRSNDKGRKTKL